jgi:hypothetical protein
MCKSRIDSVQRLLAVAMWIPQLWTADMEFDFRFPLVVQFGRSVENLLSVQVCAEFDPIASGAIDKCSDLSTDFVQARIDLIVNLQIFDASLISFQTNFFPRSTSRQDWSPIPATDFVSFDRFTWPAYLQMILCFSHRKSGHVTIEADPFVLRMGVFDLLHFRQRGLEVNLQYTSCSSLELICDIYAVVDEHVVTLEDCLAIELDGGEGIEAIKCKDMSCASTRF